MSSHQGGCNKKAKNTDACLRCKFVFNIWSLIHSRSLQRIIMFNKKYTFFPGPFFGKKNKKYTYFRLFSVFDKLTHHQFINICNFLLCTHPLALSKFECPEAWLLCFSLCSLLPTSIRKCFDFWYVGLAKRINIIMNMNLKWLS